MEARVGGASSNDDATPVFRMEVKGDGPMTERRFSDKEVALVLRRAIELEEASPSSDLPAARGMTLRELQDVAKEVGIATSLVTRAVAELSEKPEREPFSVLGPSTVKKEVRVIPGEASREDMGELMRVVDAEVAAQGTVVEALGAVRWTGNGRFLNTQVSVEPGDGETFLRVEERYSDQIRGPLHGVPTSWGLIIGLAVGLEGMSLALPVALVLAAVLGVLGWGIGDLVWRGVAASSGPRVTRLADRLTTEATRLLPPPSEQEDLGNRAPED
jgi:hypothetical protein